MTGIGWYIGGAVVCAIGAVLAAWGYGRNQFDAGREDGILASKTALARLAILANERWRKEYLDFHDLLAKAPRALDWAGRPDHEALIPLTELVDGSVRHGKR